MKIPGHFKRFSTGVASLVLAVEFTSLGFLSFVNNHPKDEVTGLFSEGTYSIIGSSLRILVGATFLAAAVFNDVWAQLVYKTLNREEILLASILISVFAIGAIACLL